MSLHTPKERGLLTRCKDFGRSLRNTLRPPTPLPIERSSTFARTSTSNVNLPLNQNFTPLSGTHLLPGVNLPRETENSGGPPAAEAIADTTTNHTHPVTPIALPAILLTVPGSTRALSPVQTGSVQAAPTTPTTTMQTLEHNIRPITPVSTTSSTNHESMIALSTSRTEEDINGTWGGLKKFASVLSVCGDYFGPLKPAINTFVSSITSLESMMEATEEYKKLRNDLNWLFHDLAGCFEKEIPLGMRPSIANIATSLEREIDFIRRKAAQNKLNRCMNAMQDADEIAKCYRRIQTYMDRLVLNANVNIWMLVDEAVTASRLEKLSPSHPAWYSSAESKNLFRDECTPDTRVEALERFQVWRDDDKGEKVYWLNGMAGTGKTTLSYTLCKDLEATHRLAANFFCSRQLPDCSDVNRIIPTIAYQLAQFSYPFRYALSQALQKHPDVQKRRLSEQCTKLLFEPLRETVTSLPHDLVIVIEALDECSYDNGIDEILEMLFKHAPQLPIRFFLTSRPEPVIRERMIGRSGERHKFELHLHELDRSIVGDDIKKYLRVGLKRAQVSEEQIEALAKRSGVLFIYAATVVRFVGAKHFSRSTTRLDMVLKASTTSGGNEKEINALYTLILTAAFDPDLLDTEKDEMRLVLYTVICAQEPLTVPIIAGLLGLNGAESVHVALAPLRSVLNIEKQLGDGITTLHKSFPDYLVDSSRSGVFYCDESEHHKYLTRRSFVLIKEPDPPFNICGLELAGRPDADVQGISAKIDEHIPGYLLYACRFWSTHLELVGQPQDLFAEMHDVLSTRLLIWMEVMNLTQRLRSEGVPILQKIHETIERAGYATETRELVKDAHDFTDTYTSSPATRSTPHLYILTLPFWPKQRPVSRYYSERVRRFMNPARQQG